MPAQVDKIRHRLQERAILKFSISWVLSTPETHIPMEMSIEKWYLLSVSLA